MEKWAYCEVFNKKPVLITALLGSCLYHHVPSMEHYYCAKSIRLIKSCMR